MYRSSGVLVLAAALVLSSCGGDAAGPGGGAPRAGVDVQAIVASLCRAQDRAAAGDAGEAARIFADEVHDALHTLVARVQEGIGRAAAAAVLEAKQQVEAAIAPSSAVTSTELAQRLEVLVVATRAAGLVLGTTVEGCDA